MWKEKNNKAMKVMNVEKSHKSVWVAMSNVLASKSERTS